MKAKRSYDQRWERIVREWLSDCGVSDDVADKYSARFCQQLQDLAEEWPSDIIDAEHEADEAARDRHEQRQIDEARGK